MQRTLIVPLAAGLLVLAGCIGAEPSSTDGAEGGSGATPPPAPPLPDPIEDSKAVSGGLDPGAGNLGAPCEIPASTGSCYRYPFTLESDARLTATLSWTVPANDFDLYLLQDKTTVAMSAGSPPATEEKLSGTKLKAGSYELVVVAYAVAQDTYTVKGEFALP